MKMAPRPIPYVNAIVIADADGNAWSEYSLKCFYVMIYVISRLLLLQ